MMLHGLDATMYIPIVLDSAYLFKYEAFFCCFLRQVGFLCERVLGILKLGL